MINAPIEGFPNRQFKILKKLGSGSQGQVFLVQSINWGENDQKNIALKYQFSMSQNELNIMNSIMNYQKQKENSGKQSYQQESLQIIKIYEIFQNNGQVLIAMEAGEQDLFCYLNSEKLSYDQKIRIMKQLSQALYFFHKTLNLLHRDIKPENFLKVGDEFKLIDFGLAKSAQQRFMTMNVGTPLFQAPEQIQGQSNYTQAVDIWSLACLFYEVLKTQPLFAGENEQQTKQFILDSSQEYLKNKLQNLEESQQLKDLLFSMLSYNPKDRLNIENVIQRLNSIQNQQNSNSDGRQNLIVKSDVAKQYQPTFFLQKNQTPPNSNIFIAQFQQNPQVQQQPTHQKTNEQKSIDQISLMQQQIMDYLQNQNFEEQFQKLLQNQNNQYQNIQQQVCETLNKFELCFNDLKNQFINQKCEETNCLNSVIVEQKSIKDELMKYQSEQKNNQQELSNNQQRNFERSQENFEHLIQEQQNILFKSQNEQNQIFQSEIKEIKEILTKLNENIFTLQEENAQLKNDRFLSNNKYNSQENLLIEFKTTKSSSDLELRLQIQKIEDQLKQCSDQIKTMNDNSQIHQSQFEQIILQAQQSQYQKEEQLNLNIILKKLTEKISNLEQEKSQMPQEFRLEKQIAGLYLEIMQYKQKLENSLSYKRGKIYKDLDLNIQDLYKKGAENSKIQQQFRDNLKNCTQQLTENLNQEIQETINYFDGVQIVIENSKFKGLIVKDYLDITKIKKELAYGLMNKFNQIYKQKN